MGEAEQTDPFCWDVDRVVQELCISNRSLDARAARKFPDPNTLRERLLEQDVDGESLLTYEDVFGMDELWKLLNLTKAPHKLSLYGAIKDLRKRSPLYRTWHRGWKDQKLTDSHMDGQEDCDAEKSLVKVQVKPESDILPPIAHPRPVAEALPASKESESPTPNGIKTPITLNPAELILSVQPAPPGSMAVVVTTSEGPPLKKRRVAPTNISSKPTLGDVSVVPTEGDAFVARIVEKKTDVFKTGTVENLLQNVNPGLTYLGSTVLEPSEITKSSMGEDDSREFIWVGRISIPAGRHLQVAQAMKRFLLSARHKKTVISEVEDDPDLPPFGDSGDEGSLDSETYREMEEEEEERERLEARKLAKTMQLSKDEILEVVQDAILALEEDWDVRKGARHDLKAWKTWRDAHRKFDRMAAIKGAQAWIEKLDARVAAMREEFLAGSWPNKAVLHRQATGNLEVTIFDRKYHQWFLHVLQSPYEPPKPSTLSLPSPPPRKAPVYLDEDVSDPETLDSDSDNPDDFIDDFNPSVIVPIDVRANHQPDPNVPAVAEPSSPALADRRNRQSTPVIRVESDLPQTPQSVAEQMPERANPSAVANKDFVDIESSPVAIRKLDELPPFEDPAAIAEVGLRYWEHVKDRHRLVITVLYQMPPSCRLELFNIIKTSEPGQVWTVHLGPIVAVAGREAFQAEPKTVMFNLARVFDCFISDTAGRLDRQKVHPLTAQRIKREMGIFEDFCIFMKEVIPHFPPPTPRTPTRIKVVSSLPSSRQGSRIPTSHRKRSTQATREGTEDSLENEISLEHESSSEDMPISSAKKRRKQHRRRDKAAADLRITNLRQAEEFDKRRILLRERLAASGTVPGDKSRLIVNETKEDDQALIYINDFIGSRIKDHQIEGVRFMWNQVVSSKVRQGCLLAHTMGLGKTMQVITLLVVIAEASRSPDRAVYSQIPKSMRDPKTLIMCPSGLVDNWVDEILMWSPDQNVLGNLFKIDSGVKLYDRVQMIKDWALAGGVVVLGYNIFTSLAEIDEVASLLYNEPSIVIGDEAHSIKNQNTKRAQSTALFKTMSRIAMTGSPLTNNVDDYYAMINWVAPNYLADHAEFKQRFSNPINQGLYADSDPPAKRKARKMLHVLKATVDPKVHRKDIQTLFNELPTKKEFIITVPLTPMQKRAYEAFLLGLLNPADGEALTNQSGVWSLVAALQPLLAHPVVFKQNLVRKANGGNAKNASQDASKDDEDDLHLPQNLRHEVSHLLHDKTIGDFKHANKILVLFKILDECKKVGDKALVFSQSLTTMDYLEAVCKRQRRVIQRLDGSTPVAARQAAIKKFNTDETEIYLISTRAGGVGLNIYGANRVVIFDFKFSPTDEQQAVGRAYRIGQTKPVYVYWLIAGGTFEDTIQNRAVFKTQLASRVVDKKNPDPWSTKLKEYFNAPTIPDQEDVSRHVGQDRVLDVLLQDKGLDGIIRKVTSTETFEREENYELTADEKREAEADIVLERLRSQNPDEFKRREQERQARLLAEWSRTLIPSSLPGAHQANSMGVPPHMRENRGTGLMPFPSPLRPQAPASEHTPSTALPTHKQTPSILTAQTVPTTLQAHPSQAPLSHAPLSHSYTSNSSISSFAKPGPSTQTSPGYAPMILGNFMKSGQPSGPPTQEAASFPPILGKGTHYKELASLLAPPTALATPSSPLDEEELKLLQSLNDGYKKLQEASRYKPLLPRDLISKILEELEKANIQGLQKIDKMQCLERSLRKPRMVEALLSGRLQPLELVKMGRVEVESKSAELDRLQQADFEREVWGSPANPNVGIEFYQSAQSLFTN
ncbi:hypothetical protein B0H63DRAFT_281484 [Podospora didyma]|uniref:Uncharacterized protein n=1 Tax=Podospora didyma TaxID=330526 RepID=A0AAE0KF35_9PEZI|nr:hypothetical protein B0H63DRAFT_281484 [Podospora didyma]